MGKISTSELDNGTVGLEITYGGAEAPFGGVDTSAPPMYIDPRCFVDANNFVVINEQLVATKWTRKDITLAGWNDREDYVGSGHFWSNRTYYNFVLGCNHPGLTPHPYEVTLEYNIWVWQASTTGVIPLTSSLQFTQYAVQTAPTPAVAEIFVPPGFELFPGTTASVQVIVNGIGLPAAVPYTSTDTPQVLAAAIETAINAYVLFPCTAKLQADGLTIVLTTTATGIAANSTTLSIPVTTTPPGGAGGVAINSPFQGAQDALTENFGIPNIPLSWVCVGEVLYLGGPGTVILKFTNKDGFPLFTILTQYLGAVTLHKFTGHLIAGGIVPGPGQVIDAPEMVIAWSAPEALGIWNPVDAAGLVTGAGFNQISDISDYITGLFISNGMMVILRTQGIDYMTSLQTTKLPFDFVHISMALLGEGCQDSRLVTQYDQVGAFVGNSDVYEFAGSLTPIGAKIKNLLIPDTQQVHQARGSASGTFEFRGTVNAYAFFLVNSSIYTYCYNDKAWMPMYFSTSGDVIDITFFAQYGYNPDATVSNWQFTNSFRPVLVDNANGPNFYELLPGVQSTDIFPFGTSSFVLFPEEEIAFGRDITIDGLLISVQGTPGLSVGFSVSGLLYATVLLPPEAATDYVTMQVFFIENTRTVQNPQLRIDVDSSPPIAPETLSFAKLTLFGSFDPRQRPV